VRKSLSESRGTKLAEQEEIATPDQPRAQRTLEKTTMARLQGKDRSLATSMSVIFSIFVALPLLLYYFRAPVISIFAVMIFSAGLVVDIFTTKAGFNRGFGDYNVFYNIVKKKRKGMRNNSFLVGAFIFGVIRIGLIYLFWNEGIILLLVASLSLLAPLWNSIMLAYPEAQGIHRTSLQTIGLSPKISLEHEAGDALS
jgi:hypothetical protein